MRTFEEWVGGWMGFDQLTPIQQAAVLESHRNLKPENLTDYHPEYRKEVQHYVQHARTKYLYKVESYSTQQIIDLFASWGWTEGTLDADDKRRIKKIKSLPRWPYVSYRATSLKNLGIDDHGDGYHRVWAAHFNGEDTVDFVFVKRR